MSPRISGGLYLNVLTARPQAGVPLAVAIFDGANPGTMLAELQNASGITFQHVLSDVGAGSFRIAVDDPKATTANIREGNLAKVRLNDVDIFPFWIESPKLVISESGKSEWQLGGSGGLQVLAQAVAYPPGWPTPTGTDRVWTTATAGTILKTLIDEAQARGALPHITYDFDGTVDSQNNPWPADLELTTHAGTTVLDVAKQLAALGITILMTPQLVFRAFVSGTFGRDLSTSVVWRYGRHIAGDVTRVGIRSVLQDAVLVEGAGGKFIEINDPTSIADPYTGRREGGLAFTSSADPTTLQNAGQAQMAITQADAAAISVPLNHGTAAGLFTPYADYVPGDWVSLDIPGQYAMSKLQLKALTLAQTDAADYTIAADLNAVALDYLVRLRNMLSSQSGSSSGASGGASGSLGLGAPPPSGTPLTTNTPAASAPGDTGAVGTGSAAAHDDHKHGREAWGLAGDVGSETFGATAVAGASGKVADAGHVHSMPANPAPAAASTVTGPDAFGASAVVGTATTYARGDHDHGLPSATVGGDLSGTLPNPTVAKVNGVAVTGTPTAGQVPTATSGTAATWQTPSGGGMTNPMTTQDDIIVGGSAGAPARLAKGTDGQVLTVDPTTHHLLWATPTGVSGFVTPSIVLGSAAAAGVATTVIRSDATIAAFDATAPVTQAFGDAAAGGSAAFAAHRDHKHGMPLNPTGLPLGLTGATATTRYVGGTTSGAPVAGTFAVGDFVIDQSGSAWVCTVAGTPGTWIQLGAGGVTLPVGIGSASASAEPFGSSYDAAKVIDGTTTTSWAINTAATNGAWWEAAWASAASVKAFVVYSRATGATLPTDNSPAATLLLSDGSTFSVPALAVGGSATILVGDRSITSARLTFTAAAPNGGNPGWSEVEAYTSLGGAALGSATPIVESGSGSAGSGANASREDHVHPADPFGRSVVLPLTNNSGASVAAGDVVYLDTAHDDSFTTGTTSAYTGGIGIAQQAIGAGSIGLVLVSGYASLVNVNASVTRGHFGSTFTVAKQATDAGSSRAAGTFCQFLTGGTTPDALVWMPDR